MRSRSLLFAGLLMLGTTAVQAQPGVRDHRQPPPGRHVPPPPPPPAAPVMTGPTEAPPTPREEKVAARSGFVWIAGRWDWRGKAKWVWVAGHWERERAGKQWRAGHWDKRGNTWAFTAGGWIDGAAMPPPGPGHDDHHDGDHHDGDHHDGDHHANDHRPHQAPPPMRAETASMKPGFVWVRGRWDWRDDKWEWVNGHYERERAHKKWREARWEDRDGTWALVDGEWVDEGAAMPPPPPPPGPPGPPMGEHHHHDWRLERPTVSSYWPAKGKAGARVKIHGKNFPVDGTVTWNSEPIKGAKITPDLIVFDVPANATSGTIMLRRDHGRGLIVGPFEVANFDAAAESRRLEDERRKAAEAAWAARQKSLSKDRAARRAAWEAREQERESTREQRRAERVAAIRAKWDAAFLADPDTQDELTLHAQRVAELTRARDVAELANNGKLVVRIDIATSREKDRHDLRMQSLQQAFRTKGGAP